MSYTYTNSETFTITHARHLVSKVSADLKRLNRFYGFPSDSDIQQYEEELVQFVRFGYLERVTYGFKKDGQWIEPTLRYTSSDVLGSFYSDDDPGKIKPNANIDGAFFSSYMSYTSSFFKLSESERNSFNNLLPFTRVGADEPTINGRVEQDKVYTSGGKSLNRSYIKSY